jgi:hypothetical protein
MKKRNICALILTSLIIQVVYPCLNTITNNTSQTYKVAEIKQENLFLKHVIDLPSDYLEDEQKAHTLKSGESVSFGGHYLPTFAIFKEYNGNWEMLLIVKQRECGPRGKEEKTLLITDLLKGELPGDYQPSYKFTFKKSPEIIAEKSIHTEELAKNKNYYQLVSERCDKHKEEMLEIISEFQHKEKRIEEVCPAASIILNNDEKGKQEEAVITAPAAEQDHTKLNSLTLPVKFGTTAQQPAAPSKLPAMEEEDLDDDGKKCAACEA